MHDPTPGEPESLTLREAAARLGYDRRTVLRHGSVLGVFRVGQRWRVPAAAVAALVARANPNPSPSGES